MKKKYLILFYAAISVYLISCATMIPIPQEKDIAAITKHFPKTQLSDLVNGRELYVNKCSGCHTLRIPSNYTKSQWQQRLPDMKVEAKISEEEAQNILRYLLTYAKDSNQVSSN